MDERLQFAMWPAAYSILKQPPFPVWKIEINPKNPTQKLSFQILKGQESSLAFIRMKFSIFEFLCE